MWQSCKYEIYQFKTDVASPEDFAFAKMLWLGFYVGGEGYAVGFAKGCWRCLRVAKPKIGDVFLPGIGLAYGPYGCRHGLDWMRRAFC